MATEKARSGGRETVGGVFLDGDGLERLKTSADRQQFASAWLAAVAKQNPSVRQGLVMLSTAGTARFEPAAIWPVGAKPERPLAASVETALRSGRTIIQTLREDQGEGVVLAVPVTISGQLRGAVAVVSHPLDQEGIQLLLDHLQWGAGWIETLIG